MVLVAQIIVDVPLMQTDRPYSYLIPEAMQGQIAIGMRVHVPFGKGNRLLQGFVIGLEEQENLRDFPELKPIAELLDYEPVLNQDQLDLADQMRHTVFSYKISILKSMLPGLLNSQYDKVIMATDKLGSTIVFKRAFLRLWLFRNGLRGVWRCETSCSRRVSQGRWQTSTSFFHEMWLSFSLKLVPWSSLKLRSIVPTATLKR